MGKPPKERHSQAVADAPDLRNATAGGATFDVGGGVNAEGLVAEMQQPSNPGSAMRNTAVEVTPRGHQQLRSLATQCKGQEGADAKRTLEMTMVIKEPRKGKPMHRRTWTWRESKENKFPTTATPETGSCAAEDSQSNKLAEQQ